MTFLSTPFCCIAVEIFFRMDFDFTRKGLRAELAKAGATSLTPDLYEFIKLTLQVFVKLC